MVDLLSIVSDIKLAVSAAQAAYKLGQDAGPFIANAADIFAGKPLSVEARAKAMAKEEELRARLHAPITDD